MDTTPDIAYQDVKEFGLAWCVQGLIVIHNNLTVIWKIEPQMDINPLGLLVLWRCLHFSPLQLNLFQFNLVKNTQYFSTF